MRLFAGACEMCGHPHLSCYIPLVLLALAFLLAACYMAMPIALEFRNEVRWLASLFGRVREFGLGRRPAPALADNVVDLWGSVPRERPALTEEPEAATADLDKAA